jgi:hypothetical protein
MRALALVAVLVSGCASETLGDNTAYRRLVDQYDSYQQCATSGFDACYQSLTLCASGASTIELDPQREQGKYTLDGDLAVSAFPRMTVRFDMEKLTSQDLPGRNAWELVEPVAYDCP